MFIETFIINKRYNWTHKVEYDKLINHIVIKGKQIFHCCRCKIVKRSLTPGGNSNMKWPGMLFVSLGDANYELWSHLGYSGQNAQNFP